MQLLSVNIGHERTQQNGTKVETTGIYKLPTNEAVEIKTLGIQSDFIASKKHHGGPDQAIYVYGAADYDWWSKELNRELAPGTFGENLTISDLESAQFNIGDRLHIGAVILEVTAPRIPCGTFAARMEDSKFVKRFREAERPGLYCRVIQEGVVKNGDSVRKEKTAENAPLALNEVFREYYNKDKTEEALRRYLTAPIAARLRAQVEDDLAKFVRKP